MDSSIFVLLGQDGLVTGAIYALLALALVLVYTVTHVPFIPIGCYVTFAALSLVQLQEGQVPKVIYVVLALGVACFTLDVLRVLRSPQSSALRARLIAKSALQFLLIPVVLCGLAGVVAGRGLPMVVEMAVALLLTVQLGPLIYRLAYQDMLEANILVLFMLSMSIDVALIGAGLVLFGPDGMRTLSYSDFSLQLGSLFIHGQSLWILAVAAVLSTMLYLFFSRSVRGKMLRATAVNRVGAQLMGISIVGAGRIAFTIAALIAAVCGLLIAPKITLSYSSGLLIGLKGFIAAVIGGFVSYPLAAGGALLIGLLESFSSFWASAWKEVIVFVLIIPVLLMRSLSNPSSDDGH